jgi:hypothetical protein
MSPRRAAPAPAAAPATWAVVLGLLTTGCGTINPLGTGCDTQSLPASDPCHGKGCCDFVMVGPDGGLTDSDAGPDAGVTTRICGACNG